MTPRTQNALTWFSLIGVATLFGAGAAWGVTSYRLNSMEATVHRIDRRVSALYCASLPLDKQAGCREQLSP